MEELSSFSSFEFLVSHFSFYVLTINYITIKVIASPTQEGVAISGLLSFVFR